MSKKQNLRRPSRRLRLLDILALVAATALGLASVRATWHEMEGIHDFLIMDGWVTIEAVSLMITFASLMLAFWTLALTFLRWLPPRPPLRSALLRPGAAACFVVSICLLLRLIGWIVHGVRDVEAGFMDGFWFGYYYGFIDDRISLTVGQVAFAVWALLLAGHRWRGCVDWIEWASRAVILAWILTAVLGWWGPLYSLLNRGLALAGFEGLQE